MMRMDGYRCECGEEHEFPDYVYAHLETGIYHTCICGRKHRIIGKRVEQLGEASPSSPTTQQSRPDLSS